MAPPFLVAGSLQCGGAFFSVACATQHDDVVAPAPTVVAIHTGKKGKQWPLVAFVLHCRLYFICNEWLKFLNRTSPIESTKGEDPNPFCSKPPSFLFNLQISQTTWLTTWQNRYYYNHILLNSLLHTQQLVNLNLHCYHFYAQWGFTSVFGGMIVTLFKI